MSASGPGYALRAVAHVHSTHSDGTATVAELRAAVRGAGARVLLLTDHDTLGARDAGEDGWGDDVLVVCGHEVSPRAGHLLVFGTDAVIGHHGGDETAILDAVGAAGGVAYPAHPFSAGSAFSTKIGRPHPWSTFDHPALRGVELWSLTTDVAESWATPGAALGSLRRPLDAALAGPPEDHVRRWDALSAAATRPLAALGGLDAHAPGVRLRGRVVSPMPHDRWMGLLQTVLTLREPLRGDDDAHDTALVLDALRDGATALAVPPLGDPLAATVRRDGDAISVDAPDGVVVRVVADGAVVHEGSAGDGSWRVDAGAHVVRIELLVARGGGLARWLMTSPL